jgi:hypothetical protein
LGVEAKLISFAGARTEIAAVNVSLEEKEINR